MSRDDIWHIAIDTGGTFTDCIARRIDAFGSSSSVHRVKLLSSAALRGRVLERLGPNRLRIDAPWLDAVPSLAGFSFRLLGESSQQSTIAGHEAGQRELVLADDIAVVQRGADNPSFEISTGEPAPVLAARLVTRTPLSEPLPRIVMRLATTRGTNALLERGGAKIAFLTNRGLRDILVIGDQQRPELFALNIRKPPPLYSEVTEVRGRLDADGCELQPLDLEEVRRLAESLIDCGIHCAAVALMHSYRNPKHEQAVAQVLRDAGMMHVACSAELAPLIEILPRAETTVVEAYLAPLIETYLDDVASAIGRDTSGVAADASLFAMTSAGGLVRSDRFRAKDSLLSGPAGGVAGAASAGRASGYERIIGFDMGGTSTDVARYDGDFEYRFEHTVGSARVVAPAIAIETVAAGGGSICGFRDGRLFVGPESARAAPGPACYGASAPNVGKLTLTDVNLLMGRIDAELFEVPIDVRHSEAAMEHVMREVQSDTGTLPDRDELLDGFLAIANERMAGAIQQVSLRRGYDPAEYALVSFGGAGGQHACAIAEMLGMNTIIMPRDASLLSAVGLSEAVIERFSQRQVLALLDELGDTLAHMFDACAAEAIAEVVADVADGTAAESVVVRRRIANVRLLGQDATIAVEVENVNQLAHEFSRRYEEMYGHKPEGKPIEVESIRVVASSQNNKAHGFPSLGCGAAPSTNTRTVRARFSGRWHDVPAHRRSELPTGAKVIGPAMVLDRQSAYVIEPGWEAAVDEAGALRVTKKTIEDSTRTSKPRDELVQLELFANRFASIALEMGQILQRTALSTNVKRRLDFSCAVLDADGQLVVNAPHIPVHLGALGLCVRSVAQTVTISAGDVIVTNHPAYGGSHLPDVTVISPVFSNELRLIGYVANRAHHAEIGGVRPGSMPPMATRLIDEGVVLPPMHLVREGESQFAEVEKLLREGKYPSRAVEDNLADLRAAVAANHRGVAALRALAERYGADEIARRMRVIREHAAAIAGQAISRLGNDRFAATERLDDGSQIQVLMQVKEDRIDIDFAGTSPQHDGNLNATPAIVRSAVLYVLRLMMGSAGEAAGLNEGIMERIDIKLPEGMLNPNFDVLIEEAPAVVGGNVETSQRIVDTLLKALGLAACSQGTMNNVLFGTESFGYYETVCGGAGAGPDFDGADAVHTHMTNTRITDPELLEHRYPVRLERFAIRKGSGGAGRHRGGDGVIRELQFLKPMSLSILSQHRAQGPYGLHGGEPGAAGRQRLIRPGGDVQELSSIDQADVEARDRLILETPGGGGYGNGAERANYHGGPRRATERHGESR